MTREEKLAYARGYNTAMNRKWPAHRPPRPPDENVAKLIDALSLLADAVDGELATLSPEDEWQFTLGPPLDAARHHLSLVSRWLLTAPIEGQ